MSKMTPHKYITYYMAHNGRSTNYPKILAKVTELWPKNQPEQQQAIALALYHSGRCCHVQGYFRHYMNTQYDGCIEGQPAEKVRALLDADCRRLVGMYEDTTITCWYQPIANHHSAMQWGAANHRRHAAQRAKNHRASVAYRKSHAQ